MKWGGHLVSQRHVDSRRHLANADLGAEHCDAEVVDWIVLHPHDSLQAQTPPHQEAEWAYVQRHPSATAPTAQRLPEGADATDRIGVGDTHHWAAESRAANPRVVLAGADPNVEIAVAIVFKHLVVQASHITFEVPHNHAVVEHGEITL